jgi:hypothetical protein
MSTPEKVGRTDAGEHDWREALIEVERARIEYADHADAADEDDHAMGRRWLRLWRAERRRDDLIRMSDRSSDAD